MKAIVAIALLGLIAIVACQEYSGPSGSPSRKHRADAFNAEGMSIHFGGGSQKHKKRADAFNAEGGAHFGGGSLKHKKRADAFNAEGGAHFGGGSQKHKKRFDDFNGESSKTSIHIKISGNSPHKKTQKKHKFDNFNSESGHGHAAHMPHPHPASQHKKTKHHKLFESDYCAMTKYAECKSALAPFLGSIEAVLGAGDAINTCLKIKECPVAQAQTSFLGNKWTTFAEDLEAAGEWLLVDSQCEQDLGAELFIASNLIVDFKSIGNDIMDIIFMALFGEKAYQACSPLI